MMKEYNTCLRIVYCAENNLNYIDLIRRNFNRYITNINVENNFIKVTFFDNTNAEFFVQHPEITNEELLEMRDYYSKSNLDNKQIIDNLMHHFNIANKLMYILFDVTEDKNRTISIINCVFAIVKETGGILVQQDRSIFNSNGELVLSNVGESRVQNFFASARKEIIIDDTISFSEEDKARIEKNIKILQENNIPYNENMKLIPSKSNTKLADEEEIFCQLIVEYLIASLAATFIDKGVNKRDFDVIYNIINGYYSVEEYISEDEKKIIEDIKNGVPISSDLTWLYEKCAVYMWVLNLWDFPNQYSECDVEKMNTILLANYSNIDSMPDLVLKMMVPNKNEISIDNLKEISIDNLKMKSYDEILEKADLLNRYKWACDEAMINNTNINYRISIPVLNYQLKAFYTILNWDPNNPIS